MENAQIMWFKSAPNFQNYHIPKSKLEEVSLIIIFPKSYTIYESTSADKSSNLEELGDVVRIRHKNLFNFGNERNLLSPTQK